MVIRPKPIHENTVSPRINGARGVKAAPTWTNLHADNARPNYTKLRFVSPPLFILSSSRLRSRDNRMSLSRESIQCEEVSSFLFFSLFARNFFQIKRRSKELNDVYEIRNSRSRRERLIKRTIVDRLLDTFVKCI